MAPRANWKGFLKIAELVCPVALYSAAAANDRIELHTINRATGHRVRRQFVDSETGKPVEKEDQVRGYEIAKGRYVLLDPEEIEAAVPESDKTLSVSAFIPCAGIDDVYLDRPYFLTPADKEAEEAYLLIRLGLQRKNVAAIAQTVLFRRLRTVLIRADDGGLSASTLHFDYEVRSSAEAFEEIPERKISGEMLELAEHIIATKEGTFDPAAFHDRYEAALADLVRAKLEGKAIAPPAPQKETRVGDLMAALRASAEAGEKQRKAG